VYVAVAPLHGVLAGSVTDVGAAGPAPCGAVNVYALLVPQALLAVTDTVPAPVPAVRVIELVVLVPLQPVPLTDHVYDVAPLTAGTVYTAVAPVHGAVGNVTELGAAARLQRGVSILILST
jgi:hypothetical protein